jgi:ABC-type uncharacterized transport system fused permease/ATPase subunit
MKNNTNKRKVIHPGNLPGSFSSLILFLMVLYLLLDKFNIPSWGWGVYGTLVVVILLIGVIGKINEDYERLLP